MRLGNRRRQWLSFRSRSCSWATVAVTVREHTRHSRQRRAGKRKRCAMLPDRVSGVIGQSRNQRNTSLKPRLNTVASAINQQTITIPKRNTPWPPSPWSIRRELPRIAMKALNNAPNGAPYIKSAVQTKKTNNAQSEVLGIIQRGTRAMAKLEPCCEPGRVKAYHETDRVDAPQEYLSPDLSIQF